MGLLVFGDTDPITKSSKYYNGAYAIAFSPEKDIDAWAAVGAAPLRRMCLESDKVTHNNESGYKKYQYKEIENANHNACLLVVARGYKGEKS